MVLSEMDTRAAADLIAQERMANAAEGQLLLGFLSLAVLVGTVLFAALAWNEARRAANEAKRTADAAESQLKVARQEAWNQEQRDREQSRQARESNRITKDATERQLRAYIGIDSCTLHRLRGGPRLALVLNNSGVTPARGVEIKVWRQFADSQQSLAQTDAPEVIQCGVLDPRQSFTAWPEIDSAFVADTERHMDQQEMKFFLHGEITYWPLAAMRQGRRKFAFQIDGIHFYEEVGQSPLVACPSGNDAR